MLIKAQGLLNAAAWVQRHHGEDVLEQILGLGSPALRERAQTAIAIEWHEAGEFEEFLGLAERVIGGPGGSVARALGAAGAEANMSGFMRRAAFYIARPAYALKRVASAWGQFNDEGSMVLGEFSAQHATVEVRDAEPPGPLFCEALSGWCEVLARRVGAKGPKARHTQCRLRGDALCTWKVTFESMPGLDKAP